MKWYTHIVWAILLLFQTIVTCCYTRAVLKGHIINYNATQWSNFHFNFLLNLHAFLFNYKYNQYLNHPNSFYPLIMMHSLLPLLDALNLFYSHLISFLYQNIFNIHYYDNEILKENSHFLINPKKKHI